MAFLSKIQNSGQKGSSPIPCDVLAALPLIAERSHGEYSKKGDCILLRGVCMLNGGQAELNATHVKHVKHDLIGKHPDENGKKIDEILVSKC